jgi:chorismate mutase
MLRAVRGALVIEWNSTKEQETVAAFLSLRRRIINEKQK